jgi:hypothetical protein
MRMIILFGFRRRLARLATVFVMCAQCGTPAAHSVTRSRRYFTLFFVPVIPLGTKYFTTCTMCGRVTQITQEGADHYVASVNQAPATSPAASTSEPSALTDSPGGNAG